MSEEQKVGYISKYTTLSFWNDSDDQIQDTLNHYGLLGWRVVSSWVVASGVGYPPGTSRVYFLLEFDQELPVEEILRLQNLALNPLPLPGTEKHESTLPSNGSDHKKKWDKVRQRFGSAAASLDTRNDDEDDDPRQWP